MTPAGWFLIIAAIAAVSAQTFDAASVKHSAAQGGAPDGNGTMVARQHASGRRSGDLARAVRVASTIRTKR